MNGRSVALWAMIALAGCGPPKASVQELHAMQSISRAGPTSGWQLSSVDWAKATQAMRDRAYTFCALTHHGDPQCLADQDWSLIASNHAEIIADNFIKHPDRRNPREMAFAQRPSVFGQVRSYCLSVYRDAGSADARMLGPCLQAALGGDYFSIAPVR